MSIIKIESLITAANMTNRITILIQFCKITTGDKEQSLSHCKNLSKPCVYYPSHTSKEAVEDVITIISPPTIEHCHIRGKMNNIKISTIMT